MKRKLFFLLIVLPLFEIYGQFNDSILFYIEQNGENKNTLTKVNNSITFSNQIVLFKNKARRNTSSFSGLVNGTDYIIIDLSNDCSTIPNNFGGITYKFNCKKSQLILYPSSGDFKDSFLINICIGTSQFFLNVEEYNQLCEESFTTKDLENLLPPVFKSNLNVKDSFDPQNRILKIDASSNGRSVRLLKVRKKEASENVKGSKGNNDNSPKEIVQEFEAKSVSSKGNISVLLKNYDINDIEYIEIELENQDFKYSTDLRDLFNSEKTGLGSVATDADLQKILTNNAISFAPTSDKLTNHLNMILEYLDPLNSINVNDLKRLQSFKSKLKNIYEGLDDNNLTTEQKSIISKILSVSPTWLNLTPIPPAVSNADVATIKVTVKNKNEEPKTTEVGKYRTIGGLGYDIGGAVYITGLTNERVFVRNNIAGITNSNSFSGGLGINNEISFKTGALIRPTLNVGAFVPLDEDITPYLAFGAGVVFQGERVKISFNAGSALGLVNTIKEEFRNIELDNTSVQDVSERKWRDSWYMSIGIRANIFNN